MSANTALAMRLIYVTFIAYVVICGVVMAVARPSDDDDDSDDGDFA